MISINKNNLVFSIVKEGRRYKTPCFLFRFLPSKENTGQVFIRVSKRTGNAVKRNLIKRYIRNMFYEYKQYLKDKDLLISYIGNITDFNVIKNDFEKFVNWMRLNDE